MKSLRSILEDNKYDDVKNEIHQYIINNYDVHRNIFISDNPDIDGKYLVDSNSSVRCGKNLETLLHPLFKWNKINGDFYWNANTKTLEGSPKEVTGTFYCIKSKTLSSLNGAPEKVGSFKCTDCKIWSLEGSPKEVKNEFHCVNCKFLSSLNGAPEKVGSFSCLGADNLRSLEGSPKEVEKDFICDYCSNIKSLIGSPTKVGRNFSCYYCTKLESLEGISEEIGGDFDCGKCRLKMTKSQIMDELSKTTKLGGKVIK